MEKDRLLFPDGRELPDLVNLTYRCDISLREEALPGAVADTTLEATVLAAGDPVAPGTALDYYRGQTLMGRFYCQTPEWVGPGQFSVTASDAMCRFDREIGPWLEQFPWPTTLQGLLEALCDHCGIPMEAGLTLPGGDLAVEGFPQVQLTGRQLLGYIGQGAGRYFRVSPEGFLRAQWYAEEAVTLGGDVTLLQLSDSILGEKFQRLFALRGAVPYQLGKLRCRNFDTAPVERVLIREREADLGTAFPAELTDANTWIIQGNPLLVARQGTDLALTAKRLQLQLANHSHRPFSCDLIPGWRVDAGSRVAFRDAGGVLRYGLVTRMQLKNGCCALSGTGSPSLSGLLSPHRLRVEDLLGRVLTLERSAQGLAARHSDISGALAELLLRFDGITTRVTELLTDAEGHATVTQLSQLEQRADSLELVFTRLQEDLEGKADGEDLEKITQRFLFDEDGLTISNSATGMGIGISQDRVVFTGGQDPATRITPTAMETTDLVVENRLDLGGFTLLPRTNGNLSLRWTNR